MKAFAAMLKYGLMLALLVIAADGQVRKAPAKNSAAAPASGSLLDEMNKRPTEAMTILRARVDPAMKIGTTWSYEVASLDRALNGRTVSITLKEKDSTESIFEIQSGTDKPVTATLSNHESSWFAPSLTESGSFRLQPISAPPHAIAGMKMNWTSSKTDYSIQNGQPVPAKTVHFVGTSLERPACIVPAGTFRCTDITMKTRTGIVETQAWLNVETPAALRYQMRYNKNLVTFKLIPGKTQVKAPPVAVSLLRFDGLYRQTVPGVGSGGSTYREYFRFYPDGDCVSVITVADAAPEKIATWFNRDSGETGTSEVSGDRLRCTFGPEKKWTSSAILNKQGFTLVESNGKSFETKFDFVPVTFPAERARMDKIPPTPGNRDPVFPTPLKLEINTNFEYDPAGRLFGGVTTIELKSPATDSDGDPITYEWSGRDLIHTEANSTSQSRIKGEGMKASWRRLILMGELASGFLTLTAYDGKGGKAVHKFCVGNRAIC